MEHRPWIGVGSQPRSDFRRQEPVDVATLPTHEASSRLISPVQVEEGGGRGIQLRGALAKVVIPANQAPKRPAADIVWLRFLVAHGS